MDKVQSSKIKGTILNILLMVIIGIVEIGAFILIWKVFKYNNADATKNIFDSVATALIIGWTGLLIGYYAWAIYFYNINLGLTNTDWAKIESAKENNQYTEDREENPHKGETLGLPPGTVRGTLTLSLVIGALAMVISSLGKSDTLPANQVFVDNWEFFKTAFLMMIAFYFGSKSLEKLNAQGIFKSKSTNVDDIVEEGAGEEIVNFKERE